MRGLKKYIAAPTIDTTQNANIATYVLFKVTTCLYLSPRDRARSLSTLIEVTVNRETVHKVLQVVTYLAKMIRQRLHRSITRDIQYITDTGSTMTPTQKSVIARLRYRSLDGG